MAEYAHGGLHKRSSYDELIESLNDSSETTNLPARLSSFLRNTPQMISLLNGDFSELENHERGIEKARLLEAKVVE